jgi:outer membrane protein assembly factor BamB
MTGMSRRVRSTRFLCFAAGVLVATAAVAAAADWAHWRGPYQTGFSPTKGLPESFSLKAPGQDSLIWKTDIGGRSTPIIVGDRLYFATAGGSGLTESERVVCLDANTGKLIKEVFFNVFHTDIVSSRLGWTTLAADPATGHLFFHGTQGAFICFDKDLNTIWQHNLTEEYGRVTGYGGRIVSPTFDSGLVIVGIVNASWGDQARGAGRFVAFDAGTGEIVWWASPTDEVSKDPRALKGTYYSNPVVAVINGQRLLITGGADGFAHALKVRTGERAWSHRFSAGVVNPSPVVDGNLVYLCHGEENPEGGPIGRAICLDASQVNAKKEPKVVWDFRRANRFGLASAALADGILYAPDDSGELFAFDAKSTNPKGKVLWKYKYGTTARGAPLVADGKLYVFDVFAKMTVLKLNGKEEPEVLEELPFRSLSGGLVETNGTPAAVNGRLYFTTRDATYCVGDPSHPRDGPAPKKEQPETPANPASLPTALRVFPADLATHPGESVKLAVKFLDANGREVSAPPDAKVEWSLPAPPMPPGAQNGPPPLKAEIKADGPNATVAVDKTPAQQGVVLAKAGGLTAHARVRVAPVLPYANDFKKMPVGAVPGGWVNAAGKFAVKEVDGKKVLSKVNTNPAPPVARANGYITLPGTRDYVIRCDVSATAVGGKLPDIGVVNCRYTMLLDGKKDPDTGKEALRLVSWEARPRVNEAVAFAWEPKQWYTMKLAVEQKEKSAVVRGKVWKVGETEPEKWTIEFEDPSPNREGAAAIYGYISNIGDTEPGSEIHYDNLAITPAAKK